MADKADLDSFSKDEGYSSVSSNFSSDSMELSHSSHGSMSLGSLHKLSSVSEAFPRQPSEMESGMVPLALDYLRSRFSTDSLYSSTSSSRGKSEVCSSGSLSSNSAGMSSDSGFMSTSSQSMDSNKDSDSFSRKNLDSSYFEKGLFVGKPEEFLQHGLQAEWSKWDPVRDIRNVLSHSLLDEMRSIFWDKDEEEDNEL